MKMDITISPKDIVENRNVKPMQVSSQVAKKASSDGTTNKQGRAAHRQSTRKTVDKLHTDFADIPKPTLSQRPAVAAEEARTVGTVNVQCRSNDQDRMKTTVMKLPTDFVRLTQGFLELAEEARNVNVEIEQCCYSDEVQTQEVGLTRPVFVTVMEYSPSVLNVGVTITPGISTERMPPISAGRRSPVDQLGLVGPCNKTDQLVLSGSDTNDGGTDPADPVGPDVSVDQSRPVAGGPVGQFVARGPVGSDGMFSMCDSDQPVAVGPVGPSVILGLVGPRRMLSQCKPDQPVADGPVGQSFIAGPVVPCGIVSKCKPNDPIADSPVGSTEIPDPVDQKERPIQIDDRRAAELGRHSPLK